MTFSSAELIDALRRRRRRSLRPERPAGESPPGWAAWFDAMKVRTDAVTGATAAAIVAIFLAPAPRLPPRPLAVLNSWQGFNLLSRRQWHPASEHARCPTSVDHVGALVSHQFFALFFPY